MPFVCLSWANIRNCTQSSPHSFITAVTRASRKRLPFMFTASKITFELGMQSFPQALFLCSMFHNTAREMVLPTARDLHFVAKWRFVILNNVLLKIPKIQDKNIKIVM